MGRRLHTFSIIKPELVAQAEARLGLEGWFTVELVHARTGLIKQRLRFKNLIVDAGLDTLGAGDTGLAEFIQYLAVGTGSTEPDVGDTQLESEMARTNSNGGFSDSAGFVDGAEPYWWYKRNRVFTEEQANGNLTELGFFRESSGPPMFNRQLFRDINGDPITVVKTNEDQLRVEFEWRIYPPTEDVDQNIVVDGVSTAFKTRAYDIDHGDRWGARTIGNAVIGYLVGLGRWRDDHSLARLFGLAMESQSLPATLTGTVNEIGGVGPNTVTFGGYSNGTFLRDMTCTWEPSEANFATGIGSVSWGGCNFSVIDTHASRKWITRLTPKVQKTDSKRFTFVGRVTWGRK